MVLRTQGPGTLLRLTFLLSILTSLGLTGLRAQSKPLPPRKDTQLWTDLQAYHALSDKTDVLVDGGLRWGRNVSDLVYERLSVGVVFKPNRHLTLTPRYTFTGTEPTATQEVRENRLGLEAVFGVAGTRWRASDRNAIERRFRDPADSNRYRNRLRFERDFRPLKSPFYLFVSDEVSYDWAFRGWSRNRFQAGGGKTLSAKLSFEVYYVRQKDYLSRPNDLHAVGVMFKTRF